MPHTLLPILNHDLQRPVLPVLRKDPPRLLPDVLRVSVLLIVADGLVHHNQRAVHARGPVLAGQALGQVVLSGLAEREREEVWVGVFVQHAVGDKEAGLVSRISSELEELRQGPLGGCVEAGHGGLADGDVSS